MKKILYIVTSDSFMKAFNLAYLKWFKDQGYEVHAAYENRFGYDIPHCDRIIDLPFKRNPFHPSNYRAYGQLKKLVENEHYDLIHCHTPIPAAIARLAGAGMRKKGTKVLYTAHGFHFYKGASIKNWLVYYLAEKLLSHVTDGIVTINKDDYKTAQRHFASARIFYIAGVGVDVNKYRPGSTAVIEESRKKLGLASDDFVLLYTAEFIPRKNHQFIIDALPELLKEIPTLKVLFAGRGILLDDMKRQVKVGKLSSCVQFLGFRQDLEQVFPAADVCISTSKQEGLGLGLAEGMMCAKSIVASKIRGHADLVEHGSNGFLFNVKDRADFISHILKLYRSETLRTRLGEQAFQTIQDFSTHKSLERMEQIYKTFLGTTDLIHKNNNTKEAVVC